jgi:hypothetical protein
MAYALYLLILFGTAHASSDQRDKTRMVGKKCINVQTFKNV